MTEEKSLQKIEETFDAQVTLPEDRYQELLEELRDIVDVAITTSRLELVQAKWRIGQRIMAEFQESGLDASKEIIYRLAKDLKTSVSELYRCTEFYNKYLLEMKCETFDDILSYLPEGKNISWNKIKMFYLPELPAAKIPYIVPKIEVADDWGLFKWWAEYPDRHFEIIVSNKKYDFKLQVKMVQPKNIKTTKLMLILEELRNLYIELKRFDAHDLDDSDYGRMNKPLKRLLMKAKGDGEKIKKAIRWVASQDYIDWSLETVEKKYADAIRPVKEYERFMKKKPF